MFAYLLGLHVYSAVIRIPARFIETGKIDWHLFSFQKGHHHAVRIFQYWHISLHGITSVGTCNDVYPKRIDFEDFNSPLRVKLWFSLVACQDMMRWAANEENRAIQVSVFHRNLMVLCWLHNNWESTASLRRMIFNQCSKLWNIKLLYWNHLS